MNIDEKYRNYVKFTDGTILIFESAEELQEMFFDVNRVDV